MSAGHSLPIQMVLETMVRDYLTALFLIMTCMREGGKEDVQNTPPTVLTFMSGFSNNWSRQKSLKITMTKTKFNIKTSKIISAHVHMAQNVKFHDIWSLVLIFQVTTVTVWFTLSPWTMLGCQYYGLSTGLICFWNFQCNQNSSFCIKFYL